jgi:hypothetical protein
MRYSPTFTDTRSRAMQQRSRTCAPGAMLGRPKLSLQRHAVTGARHRKGATARVEDRRSSAHVKPDAVGYRNGYGTPRSVALLNGTITVRRPRVRGLDARFERRILPLFQRRTPDVAKLLPERYLYGLSSGDFTLALRGLLGEGAPLSASSMQRRTED